MTAKPRKPGAVDHLVLPVTDLATARSRYESLGFVVAPDGRHPFGTENCCVYFADGTFLEPLAIAQREDCEASAMKGNVFTARDQAYRFRRGQDGFSALVMASQDAAADHKRFVKQGMSAGKVLEFSRTAQDASGKKGEASFKLAFAADLRAPDAFFFTCERINVPKIDRTALTKHPNGAISIREVALGEPNPTDFQYLLEEVLNQREVNAHSFGMEMQSANANVAVYTGPGLKAWYGVEKAPHARGLRLRAFSLGVKDLGKTGEFLARAGHKPRKVAHRLVIDPAPGQGVIIAFEEV